MRSCAARFADAAAAPSRQPRHRSAYRFFHCLAASGEVAVPPPVPAGPGEPNDKPADPAIGGRASPAPVKHKAGRHGRREFRRPGTGAASPHLPGEIGADALAERLDRAQGIDQQVALAARQGVGIRAQPRHLPAHHRAFRRPHLRRERTRHRRHLRDAHALRENRAAPCRVLAAGPDRSTRNLRSIDGPMISSLSRQPAAGRSEGTGRASSRRPGL